LKWEIVQSFITDSSFLFFLNFIFCLMTYFIVRSTAVEGSVVPDSCLIPNFLDWRIPITGSINLYLATYNGGKYIPKRDSHYRRFPSGTLVQYIP
jgi:hypothetical protein